MTMLRIEVALVIAVAAVYVYSEVCTTNSDCTSTGCTSANHVVCEHQNPEQGVEQNGGLCTCKADNVTCTTRDDCNTTAILTSLNCISDDRLHCYDNKCICTRYRRSAVLTLDELYKP